MIAFYLWQLTAGVATIFAVFVILCGLAQNLVHLGQLVVAGAAMVRTPPEADSGSFWQRYAKAAPPIALLAPAYNEALTVAESVRSLLSIRYPEFEIIVINDGSTDETLQILIDTFSLELTRSRDYELVVSHRPIRGLYASKLHPRLLVIDKENGGKADALNAGLNLATAPVVCSMDADSLLEPDSLLRAVQPFLEDPQRVIAVGGTIRVANGCTIADGRIIRIGAPRNLLALMQTVEYLRAFLMARLAWSQIGALTIISGAFGLFRRSAVLEVGGYAQGTVGEDMELVVRLHRHFREARKPYTIAFVPEPVCWTEAPETLGMLARQRARWHRGSLETFDRHKEMAFNPRYGAVGVVGFGWIVLSDVLGPPTELMGYVLIPIWWSLGVLSTDYLLAFLAVTFAFGVALSVGALALEESELHRFPRARDLLILTGAAILENFGYRQLNQLWRLRGTLDWFRGATSWGEMTRKGFKGA
ncbi:MAG TPA: glycosyltransferase family 2 protein [Caulobacteraceae bacterium]|nr:glycosyltransferase family 2 protein [Caulobacteraceae bacterium]